MNSLWGALRLLSALRSRSCFYRHKSPGARPHGIVDQCHSGQCISTPTHTLKHPHSVMISSLCKRLPTDALGSDRIGALSSLNAFRDLILFSLGSQMTAGLPKTRLPPFYTLLSTVLPSAFPSDPASSPEASWLNKQTDQNKHEELRRTHSFTAQTKYGCFAVCWDTLVNTDKNKLQLLFIFFLSAFPKLEYTK